MPKVPRNVKTHAHSYALFMSESLSFSDYATCERSRRACPGMHGSGVLQRALLPTLLCFQIPAECRWTSNVRGPHLSPLLSEDRRSYTLKQRDTKHTHTGTQCSPASDTAALLCFGNDSLGISHGVRKMFFFLTYYRLLLVGWLHLRLAFPKNSAKMCLCLFIQMYKETKNAFKKK